MGLFDWLKNLIFPPAQRDVSQLEIPENLIDVVHETVDLSGKPLKEHHRRRSLRDPRLLPKKTPFIRLFKRPPWISFEESSRLFSSTMRTKSRTLRDLLCDEEQLKRLNLPLWKTETDVAEALGINVKLLRHYSIHRERERLTHYVTFAIPKRNGEKRLIMAPKKRLKALLRLLNQQLVQKLPVSEQAHGFKPGGSVRTNAEGHVGKAFVVKFDLRDFFPTLHFGRVRGYLVAMGFSFPVATTLAVLMTEAERQPVQVDDQTFYVPVTSRYCVQGAPTSPGLANAIFLKADRRLYKLAQKIGCAYSRYADDLTFSADQESAVTALFKYVPLILRDEGFEVNEGKTRVMRAAGRQRVTGATVNQVLGLSKNERRRIRAAIHQSACNPQSAKESRATLKGKIAWVNMLNPEQAQTLERHWEKHNTPK